MWPFKRRVVETSTLPKWKWVPCYGKVVEEVREGFHNYVCTECPAWSPGESGPLGNHTKAVPIRETDGEGV